VKLVACFFGFVKTKKQTQIISFLDLFLTLVNSKEAQVSITRIPDLVDNLLELVVWKNQEVAIPSLDLVRRLLQQRESKSIFLANGIFLTINN
jgi:hypothetical protein